MLQIEKERSLAKPNQLPAGPRKKRPLGRLFSSAKYYKEVLLSSTSESVLCTLAVCLWCHEVLGSEVCQCGYFHQAAMSGNQSPHFAICH